MENNSSYYINGRDKTKICKGEKKTWKNIMHELLLFMRKVLSLSEDMVQKMLHRKFQDETTHQQYS